MIFQWQDIIIPTNPKQMTPTTHIELMTHKLFNIKEIFARLDPEQFSQILEPDVLWLMDSIIDDVANQYMPKTWNQLPQEVRDDVAMMAYWESHRFLFLFMTDLQEHIEDVLDIKHVMVSAYGKHTMLVNKICQECRDEEFTFIQQNGIHFKFVFGIISMTIWFFYTGTTSWRLPLQCFILVGWLTNYIPLKLLFRPRNPIQIGYFNLQGLFFKRQTQISETFAKVYSVEIFHTRAIWVAMFKGPLHRNFYALLRTHSIIFTEDILCGLRPIAVAVMGKDKFAEMKDDIATELMDLFPTILDQSYEYMTEALRMEDTIREKMQRLTKEEFEGVLYPAFEEEKMRLIWMGCVLGLIVGVVQYFDVFAG